VWTVSSSTPAGSTMATVGSVSWILPSADTDGQATVGQREAAPPGDRPSPGDGLRPTRVTERSCCSPWLVHSLWTSMRLIHRPALPWLRVHHRPSSPSERWDQHRKVPRRDQSHGRRPGAWN
jgi:hypothetical protein